MKRTTIIATFLVLLLLVTGVAYAQAPGYTLPWWTTGGGGGASAGGNYRLAGTIAQPVVGALTGGNYRLESGYWSGMGVSGSGCLNNQCYIYLPVSMKDFVTPFLGPWEIEPNNTYLTANGPLISGQPYTGYLNDAKDYFSIFALDKGFINVSVTVPAGSVVQLQVFYKDVSGAPVAYKFEPPYKVAAAIEPGWYFIYIYTVSGYNTSQPYALTVSHP